MSLVLPMNHSSQIRMTNDEIRRNDEFRRTKPATAQLRVFRHSGFGFLSSFVIQRLVQVRFMVRMHSENERTLSMSRRLLICMVILVAWQHGCLVYAADTNKLALQETVKPMDFPDDHQKLGPGDRVTYRVIEDQDEPRSLTVTDSGDLEVPYYGLVHAAGKTSRQLAREIRTLLERQLYYQATVILAVEVVNKARVNGKVYVTGKVRKSGGYEIPAGENFTV